MSPVICLLLSSLAHGATIFKTSTSSISQSNSADWSSTSGVVAPMPAASGDVAEFGALTGPTTTFTLSENVTLEGLRFADGLSSPITLGASAHQLQLGASGMVFTTNSQNVKISQNLTLTSTQTWEADLMQRGMEIDGSIASSAATHELTLKGNFTNEHGTTLNPAIATAAGANPRAFVFSGSTANTYTGKTIVETGLLILKKTNGVTAVAGDLDIKGASAVYLAADHQIASTAVLNITGGGKLILNGRAQTIGGLNGSTSTSLVEATSGGGIASTLHIHTALGSSYHFNGGIFRDGGSQPLSIVKSGAGTQIVNGSMQFTGGLTVNEGIFVIRANGNNNNSGNVRVIHDWKSNIQIGVSGTLQLDHTNAVVFTESLTRKISGAGRVEKTGTGTIRLTADNTGHTGSVTITAGSLEVSGGLAINNLSAVILSNTANAGLTVVDSEGVGSLAGGGVTGGNISLGSQTLTVGYNNTSTTYSGIISGTGNFTKVGSGTQTLSGSNTFSGVALIESGILSIQGGTAIADIGTVRLSTTDASATFHVAASEVIGRLEGGSATGGLVDLRVNALTVSEGNFAGKITGIDRGPADVTLQHKFSSLIKAGAGTLYLTNTTSDYKGFTELHAGILNVASIGDVGQASSIGQRMVENSFSDVGLIFRGGTLQYTGATAQSTNRAVRIDINGGAYIDASGSNHDATLSFTRTSSPDFFVSSGNRQLTLTGTNQGNNTWNMNIVQTGGVTTLNKTGTGHWRVTGSNNVYTGATNIQQGALLINGTVGSTAITVSSGAKLGGTGTIGGVTVVQGQLSPGGDSSLTSTNFSTGFGFGTLQFSPASSLTFSGADASFFVQLGTASQSDRIDLASASGSSLNLGTSTQLLGSFLGSNSDLKESVSDESYSKYWIAVLADGAASSGQFSNAILRDSTFWSAQLGGGALSSDWNNAHLVTVGSQMFALFYTANFSNQNLTGGNDLLLIAVIPEPHKAVLLGLGFAALFFRRRR